MGFRTVVASNDRALSASEGRVMNVLLGPDMTGATAAQVAARAKTHESTVVRLAQKLGYRGYPDLRADLRRDEGVRTSTSIMRGSTGYQLAALVEDELAALRRVTDFVPQDTLDAAARTLHSGSSVYIFSNADELPVRELMARRLRRLGMTVVTMGPDAKDLAEHFVSFGGTSTFVGFALREAPRQLSTLVGEVGRRGGRSILVTDVPGFRFRPTPDHLVAADRGGDDEYRTQLIPVMLCYALQLATYHLDPERYQRAREDIDDLTRMLGGADEIPLRQ